MWRRRRSPTRRRCRLSATSLYASPQRCLVRPIIASQSVMADSIIVGNLVGEDALAAVGASYSFTTVFIMIAIGGGIGASVLYDQRDHCRDALCDHRGDRSPGNAHLQAPHHPQIQYDIQYRRKDQQKQRDPGPSQRVEICGQNIVHLGAGHYREMKSSVYTFLIAFAVFSTLLAVLGFAVNPTVPPRPDFPR
mgnify:CR=1 FL=1